jgi:hypothetical protein
VGYRVNVVRVFAGRPEAFYKRSAQRVVSHLARG